MRADAPAVDAAPAYPRSGGRADPALDGCRAVAALMVLTTHVAFFTAAILWPGVGPMLARLDFGVAIFFLLSGFLLVTPWVRAALGAAPAPSTATYLLRRWARIVPAYWLVLIAAVVALPENRDVDPGTLAQYAALLQIYDNPNRLAGLTQMWSLAVEVAFYLALPLIGWWLVRRTATVRSLLGAVLVLVPIALAFRWLATAGWPNPVAGYWLLGYLDWFALGMAAAVIREATALGLGNAATARVRAVAEDGWTCVICSTLLFVIACTPVAGPYTLGVLQPWENLIRHLLYAAAAAFALLPVFLGAAGHPVRRALSVRPVAWLGRISYGIFLWHLLLMELIARALGLELFRGGFIVLWPLTFVSAVAAAWLSWVLVEQPLQRWSHRRSTGPTLTTATTTATTTTAADTVTRPTHVGAA